MLRIEFLTQMSLKDSGKIFWEKHCMNWILEKVIRSGSGRILSFLKRGSVWELYEEPEIILTADFCNLNKSLIGPEREQDQIIVA